MTNLDPLHVEKAFYALFPERFKSLHDDPQLVQVYERFGIEVFRRSAVLEGFDSFVRQVGLHGRRCVEIGTCAGLTAIVLARYFEEVVTIDIAPNEHKRAIAEHVGANNIRFVEVHDNAEKAEVLRALHFDAAFVDGDHARDTETDFQLVARCGRVLFHEHWEPQPAVMNLVRGLRARGGHVLTSGKWAYWDGGA